MGYCRHHRGETQSAANTPYGERMGVALVVFFAATVMIAWNAAVITRFCTKVRERGMETVQSV